MLKRMTMLLALLLALVLAACGGAAPTPATAAPTKAPTEEVAAATEEAAAPAAAANIAAVKDYAVNETKQLKIAADGLQTTVETYYSLIAAENFDYEAAWTNHQPELTELLTTAKAQLVEAHNHYELSEGIVAGVPSLAFYDVWIDAGPSAAEAPDEALAWQLVLPDGKTLDSPGNLFHSLIEPTLYGTVDEFTGLKVDLDGNGTTDLGEALPEANTLLAATQGLDKAATDLEAAVAAWEPSLKETFGALATMTPTMNEYFEQWKLSSFVSGDQTSEVSFIAASRLFDIIGILNGLNVAYTNVSPAVAATDPDLDAQLSAGYKDLFAYVDDLYQQELGGKVFTAEEADLFGTEAQDAATTLSGQVAQAAALSGIELTEEDPTIPEGPIVITAVPPTAQ